MDKRNVTLSLPEPLLKRFRVLAAKNNVSMSSLMENAISRMVLDEDDYDIKAKRAIERMKNAPNLGSRGRITWTREELHERVR